MPKMILIRGLPGSGKTELGAELKEKLGIKHHYEADMWFIDSLGNYFYERDRVADAHEWCKRKVYDAVSAGEDVIVSNTFSMKWEMEYYVQLAKEHGYDIEIMIANGVSSKIGEIDPRSIDRMKDRWEDVTVDDF